jgi:hypothetical protein
MLAARQQDAESLRRHYESTSEIILWSLISGHLLQDPIRRPTYQRYADHQ